VSVSLNFLMCTGLCHNLHGGWVPFVLSNPWYGMGTGKGESVCKQFAEEPIGR
jgi:hypothetical protein